MSEEVKAPAKKKKTNKQVTIGWVAIAIIAVQVIFGAGLYVGTQATLNSQAHEASVKAEAIDQYKAELLKENQ